MQTFAVADLNDRPSSTAAGKAECLLVGVENLALSVRLGSMLRSGRRNADYRRGAKIARSSTLEIVPAKFTGMGLGSAL
jgi:hypothetical protein